MYPSRRNRVARAVEGLQHDHAIGVGDVAVAQNAQARGCERKHGGIVGEETDGWRREKKKDYANDVEEQHVVKARAPDRNLRALRLLGTEILADKSGRGVAQAPTGQEDENKNADGDGVTGQSIRAEHAHNAHETDPAGMRNEELQNARERNAQQSQQNAKVHADLFAQNADALGAAQQAVKLIEHADAAAGERCEGRASNAELWEWAPAENEARIEDEIDDV